MKRFTLCFVGVVCLALASSIAFAADDDKTPTTRTNPNGVPVEGYVASNPLAPTVPIELETALKDALGRGDAQEVKRIQDAMQQYLPVASPPSPGTDAVMPLTVSPTGPNGLEWSLSDIQVWAGSVKYGGLREIDLKRADDGNLYLAINKAGGTGSIGVYKSTNGGATWTMISGATSSSYFGELSMSIDVRSSTGNLDSTRICLYFTISPNSTMTDAGIHFVSFLRDGSAWYGYNTNIEAITAGHKFGSPSAFSDGAYYTTNTYLGLVAAEYTNDGDSTLALRLYRSTDWGATWAGVTLSASYQDFYPTATLMPGTNSGNDSVYIAVERRFTPTYSLVRVVAAKFNPPTASALTYYVPPTDTTYPRYQRPVINVRQTGREYGFNRDVLITVAKNGAGYYHCRSGAGAAWGVDYNLASSVNVAYTFCASDSLTSGGGYFMAAYTDVNGDTLGVRRGIFNQLGTRIYHNDHKVSTSVMPSCAIYKSGTTKYSAYAYAGLGPTNVYFNQESLPATGVDDQGEVAGSYELAQNYPNPFNPTTVVSYQLPVVSNVRLAVFDMLGREVAVLVNEKKEPGRYEVQFNGKGLSSGVYFYRLESKDPSSGSANGFVQTRKLVLLR
jgi:hypothetical protein